jgi:hypothetical protein
VFAVAFLLVWLLIGILVLFYLLIVKPEGTLTVTYELRGGAPATSAPDATLARRLAELDDARRSGLLDDQEYAEKRQQIIGRF